MKPIKEYINDSLIAGKETFEGLFDDEDDLLNKMPNDAIIDWFNEHVRFNKSLHMGFIPASEALSISDNGTISFQITHGCGYIEYYEQPPKWMKFDEKTWKNAYTYIYYDVTSQRDIENIPLGKFNRIAEIRNNKTQNLTLNETCNINSSNIKNITYTVNSNILVGAKDLNQLTEIKFTNYSNQNWISLYYNDLGDRLAKEHGRLKTKAFVNKYKDVLTKLRNNNVYALQLNSKKRFILEEIL